MNLYLFSDLTFNKGMTVVSRNTIITAGIIINFFILGFSIFAFADTAGQAESLRAILDQDTLLNCITAGFLLVFSLVYGIVLRISFSKTLSAEMFFFSIFIITLSFEALRGIILYLSLKSAPFLFGIVATKAVLFARFMRAYAIFGAGLSAYGTRNPKTGIFLGVGALLAFAFAAAVPVDATRRSFDLLFYTSAEKVMNIIILCSYFISLMTFVLAGYLKNMQEYSHMAIGLFITVMGTQMIILLPDLIPISGAGILLLTGGSIFFSKRTHDLYLWG